MYRVSYNRPTIGTPTEYQTPNHEEALRIAREAANLWQTIAIVEDLRPHPLARFGVSTYNPIAKVTPKTALATKEPLANLEGHNSGDVRISSCDPTVYPFVPYFQGGYWKLVHPTLDTGGWKFGCLKSAQTVARIFNRPAARACALSIVASCPVGGSTYGCKAAFIDKTISEGVNTLVLHFENPEILEKVLWLVLLVNRLPTDTYISIQEQN